MTSYVSLKLAKEKKKKKKMVTRKCQSSSSDCALRVAAATKSLWTGLEREREQTVGCIQISKRKVGPDKERRTSHVAKEGHAEKGETKLEPNH